MGPASIAGGNALAAIRSGDRQVISPGSAHAFDSEHLCSGPRGSFDDRGRLRLLE
jgi:hypothetical protein